MNINEIIDCLKLAVELACDGGPSPFTEEQYKEMNTFLDGNRMPEHGCHQWCMGEKPRWNVGDYIAHYECYSDYEGESFYGEIIRIEKDDEYGDWLYIFKDKDGEYAASEESMCDEECYKVSKEYYENHC